MIRKINNRAEIIDAQMTLELIAISLLFMAPIIYSNFGKCTRKDSVKKDGKGRLNKSSFSYMADLSTSDEDLESLL